MKFKKLRPYYGNKVLQTCAPAFCESNFWYECTDKIHPSQPFYKICEAFLFLHDFHLFKNLYIFNVFKYHVSCTDGKISVRIKIGITFIFRFLRRPIQLVVFIQLPKMKLRHSTRPAENVLRTTKCLKEWTQLIERD